MASHVLACPHFPACSGCTEIGKTYDAQLEAKLGSLRKLFARAALGDFDARAITKVTPSPDPHAYRNRIRLAPAAGAGAPPRSCAAGTEPVDADRAPTAVKLGLYRAGSHAVVDIPGCPVQMNEINELVEIIRTGIGECGLRLYDEIAHGGDLRYVTVRRGAATGESLVGFVTRDETCPGVEPLARLIMDRGTGVVGVVQNINPEPGNVIFGSRSRVLAGRDYVTEAVCGVRLRLGLTSFFQANSAVAQRAYDAIVRHLCLDRRTTLLDLYSGVGAIGLVASSAVHRVVGIEESAEAVEFAEDAKDDNGIGNAEFRCGLVTKRLPSLVNDLRRTGTTAGRLTVVVNPPRKGLDTALTKMLARMGSIRIGYLSCSPPTLVRDLQLLVAGGYRVRHVELFDMFPQTQQVETLAVLERRLRAT